ncbi:MAG: class I SAM-dependent methyltransferase [Nitrososphaeria archaeon]
MHNKIVHKLEGPWKHKLDTIKHYNALAKAYDKLYGQEQKMKIDFILKNLDLKNRRKILDVGCGTCILFESLYDEDKIFVGVDISEKILRIGWIKFRDKINLFLVLADAEHLPFRDKVFDTIFTITLIQNLPNPIRSLEEIKRVSSRDAAIIVSGLKSRYTFKEFNTLIKNVVFLKESYDVEDLKDYIAFSIS